MTANKDKDLEELEEDLKKISVGKIKTQSTKKTPPPIPSSKVPKSKKLEDYLVNSWICIPDKTEEGGLRLRVRELEDCPMEDFKDWVEYIYPVSKKSGHQPESYKKIGVRESSLLAICDFYSRIRQVFSLYSPSKLTMEGLSQTRKKETKEGK